MSTNRNRGCAKNYGLLNSVRHAECGSVFYRGPCPRAGVVSPGICISPSGEVSGCNVPRDTHRAPICCDPDCIAEVSASADEHDHCCHNCNLRCRCWRREDQNGGDSDSVVCRCRSNDSECDAVTEVRIRETEVAGANTVREAEIRDDEEVREIERKHEEEEPPEEENRGGNDFSHAYDYSRGFDYRRGAWAE